MISKNGTGPSKLDPRDYSFHKTFAHYGAASPVNLPLDEYNFDSGLDMPDQNADGFPNGCTGYTQSNIAEDEDKASYDPSYTYLHTCVMEGHDYTQGCDIRTSAKCGQVNGMQVKGDTDLNNATKHRRGAYFSVDQAYQRDWFDSFRIALRNGKPISCGTPWFPEWERMGTDGILPDFTYDGNPNDVAWHNFAIKGETTINGLPYLRIKSWQGSNYGQNGWCFMSRDVFNKAFDINGTIALVQAEALPQDTVTIQLTLLQWALVLMGRYLGLPINLYA